MYKSLFMFNTNKLSSHISRRKQNSMQGTLCFCSKPPYHKLHVTMGKVVDRTVLTGDHEEKDKHITDNEPTSIS